jgi:hypothetical protein
MARARITILDAEGEAAVYFVDAAGVPWRVYHTVQGRAERAHAATPAESVILSRTKALRGPMWQDL